MKVFEGGLDLHEKHLTEADVRKLIEEQFKVYETSGAFPITTPRKPRPKSTRDKIRELLLSWSHGRAGLTEIIKKLEKMVEEGVD